MRTSLNSVKVSSLSLILARCDSVVQHLLKSLCEVMLNESVMKPGNKNRVISGGRSIWHDIVTFCYVRLKKNDSSVSTMVLRIASVFPLCTVQIRGIFT